MKLWISVKYIWQSYDNFMKVKLHTNRLLVQHLLNRDGMGEWNSAHCQTGLGKYHSVWWFIGRSTQWELRKSTPTTTINREESYNSQYTHTHTHTLCHLTFTHTHTLYATWPLHTHTHPMPPDLYTHTHTHSMPPDLYTHTHTPYATRPLACLTEHMHVQWGPLS